MFILAVLHKACIECDTNFTPRKAPDSLSTSLVTCPYKIDNETKFAYSADPGLGVGLAHLTIRDNRTSDGSRIVFHQPTIRPIYTYSLQG